MALGRLERAQELMRRRSGRRRHTSLLSDSACSVLFAKMWNANWDGKYKRSRLDGCRLGMMHLSWTPGDGQGDRRTVRRLVPGGRGSLPPLSSSGSPVPTGAPSPCEVLSKYLWNGGREYPQTWGCPAEGLDRCPTSISMPYLVVHCTLCSPSPQTGPAPPSHLSHE